MACCSSTSPRRTPVNASDNVVVLPVLPLKNTGLFPYLVMPPSGRRPAAVAAAVALLEPPTRLEARRVLHGYLSHEVQVLELRKKISTQAETEMSKQQRDYMLRQQMQAIQQELGEKNPEKAEIDELRRRLAEAELPEEAKKEAERELVRLERLPPAAPDHQVIRSYLELLLELPWKKSTVDVIDLGHTRKILDEDHYGLEEVKERIIEDLAVLKLNPEAR